MGVCLTTDIRASFSGLFVRVFDVGEWQEFVDTALGGDRRGRRVLDFEETAAHMRPTEGEHHIVAFR